MSLARPGTRAGTRMCGCGARMSSYASYGARMSSYGFADNRLCRKTGFAGVAALHKEMIILSSVLVRMGYSTSCVGINLGDPPRGLRHPRGSPRLIPPHSVRISPYVTRLPQVLSHSSTQDWLALPLLGAVQGIPTGLKDKQEY